jgi:iron complex outermembrane receptor protein
MRLRWPTLLFHLLVGYGACAQLGTDTIKLKEAVVTGTRLSQFSSGTKVQTVDSITLARYRANNLGDLLADESPVFVKSYGLGSLATTSFRGGSANHTAVLWNGFNIGSPMNGMIDLSLIPLQMTNSVSVQYGGTSALWGSGAVGGAIHLNNVSVFDRGLTVDAGASFGSFGDRRQNARVEIARGRWISSIGVFNAVARNDFTYFNPQVKGEPLRQQSNAQLKQVGLLVEEHYRINARQRVNLRFWYQTTDRHIPPTTLQETSSARQADESYRTTAEWQRVGDRVKTVVRAAYFDEQLSWYASAAAPASLSRSRTAITEAEARIRLTDRQLINVGLNHTYAQAFSDGYPDEPHQNRTALFASYQLTTADKRSTTTLSGRQELVADVFAPLTAALGSEYTLTTWLTAKANAARVYRIPTFNDLYWNPGGDRDLLPEDGYSGEAGLAVQCGLFQNKARLTGDVTGYSRTMDNWIIWLPGPGYWSPQNIMQVWSRGVETRGEIAVPVKQATIKLAVMTNYVLSTNQVAKSVNDASVGKQLIYVPMYSGNGKVTLLYKGLIATFGMTYTGYRYTSTDNKEFLEPYWLANASVSYRLPWRGTHALSVMAQGFNLLDERYEVIRNRPMPLRNFQVGISVRFNQPLPALPTPRP